MHELHISFNASEVDALRTRLHALGVATSFDCGTTSNDTPYYVVLVCHDDYIQARAAREVFFKSL
jgi:hypothetical protein